MELDEVIAKAVTALLGAAGGGGLFGGLALWLAKRWVAKVDSRLSTLTISVNSLVTQNAVATNQVSSLAGAVESNRKSIKDILVVAASLTKLWAVLEAKGLVDGQGSDEVIRNIKS